jgi:transcriptional regulator with XRE-family HTH domain
MTHEEITLIGNRIKSRRLSLKYTQKDVASMVSVDVSTISRYEKGLFQDIKIPVIEAIAKALQCNPAWLMGYDVPIEPQKPSTEEILMQAAFDKAKADLCAKLYNQMTDENFDKWLEYGEWLLSRQNKE